MLGVVVALWRYPVKSMAAEPLEAAYVSWHGLAGDRRWGFVREGVPRNGFPWLTIRQRPELLRYRARLADPARPDASKTFVRTPSGAEYDVVDPALAAEIGGARVMKLDRGTFDSAPLSLITLRSLGKLDARRFRPNLVVDAAGECEDDWVGRELRVGGFRMRVDRRDNRCVIVNFDPDTVRHDPDVLRSLARDGGVPFGVYGTTVEPGHVEVGDKVEFA